MHVLQPKIIKLNPAEVDSLLKEFNISLAQLPKIRISDPALPEGCEISDILKIERITDDKKAFYYRVVGV